MPNVNRRQLNTKLTNLDAPEEGRYSRELSDDKNYYRKKCTQIRRGIVSGGKFCKNLKSRVHIFLRTL
jgi:hypothetical protein